MATGLNIAPFGETTKPVPYNGFVMDGNDASCKAAKKPITAGVEASLETGNSGFNSACRKFIANIFIR